jgi:hypothetical protein
MPVASGSRDHAESAVRPAALASKNRWWEKRKFLIPAERAGLFGNRFSRAFLHRQRGPVCKGEARGRVFGVAHRRKSRKMIASGVGRTIELPKPHADASTFSDFRSGDSSWLEWKEVPFMVPVLDSHKTLFTLDQARSMLPLLRLIVADIQLACRELAERRLHLHRMIRRHEGRQSSMHLAELEDLRQDIQEDARRFELYVEELEKLGVLLRSAEVGVVDFPTVIDEQLGFFTWKPDDRDIAFWHSGDQSWTDREPIANTDASVP